METVHARILFFVVAEPDNTAVLQRRTGICHTDFVHECAVGASKVDQLGNLRTAAYTLIKPAHQLSAYLFVWVYVDAGMSARHRLGIQALHDVRLRGEMLCTKRDTYNVIVITAAYLRLRIF